MKTVLRPSPSVGIFWGLRDSSGQVVLLTDGTPLTEAERYGDALTHPGGHYEFWEGLRSLSQRELKDRGIPLLVKSDEYEDWPRGRVVYETVSKSFILYMDRKLQTPPIPSMIVERFGLRDEAFRVASDPHYRSRRGFSRCT